MVTAASGGGKPGVTLIITAWFNPDKDVKRQKYIEAAGVIFKKHGGGGGASLKPIEALVGDFEPDAVALVPFPSEEACRNAFSDPDYLELVPIRDEAFRRLNYTVARLDS